MFTRYSMDWLQSSSLFTLCLCCNKPRVEHLPPETTIPQRIQIVLSQLKHTTQIHSYRTVTLQLAAHIQNDFFSNPCSINGKYTHSSVNPPETPTIEFHQHKVPPSALLLICGSWVDRPASTPTFSLPCSGPTTAAILASEGEWAVQWAAGGSHSSTATLCPPCCGPWTCRSSRDATTITGAASPLTWSALAPCMVARTPAR